VWGVRTRNKQEPESPTRNWVNRMVQFSKLDYPVSSAPAAIRGTVDSGEGVLFIVKWHLTRERDKIHDNSRSCGGG
jgi:hypothetical protein